MLEADAPGTGKPADSDDPTNVRRETGLPLDHPCPDITPGFTDVTVIDAPGDVPWRATDGGPENFPVTFGDLDGDCSPPRVHGTWVHRVDPASCGFEVITARRRLDADGQVVEAGLVYTHDAPAGTWEAFAPLPSLGTAGMIDPLAPHMSHVSALDLLGDEADELILGAEVYRRTQTGWERLPDVATACDAPVVPGTGIGFVDADRDGWVDRQFSLGERATTCRVGPVVTALQLPQGRQVLLDSFLPDPSAAPDDRLHDAYAFAFSWRPDDGAAVVFSAGRAIPSHGQAPGVWWEVGRDAAGFPMYAPRAPSGAPLTPLNPMGGDFVDLDHDGDDDLVTTAERGQNVILAPEAWDAWVDVTQLARVVNPDGGGHRQIPWAVGVLTTKRDLRWHLLVQHGHDDDTFRESRYRQLWLSAYCNPGDFDRGPFVAWPEASTGDLDAGRGYRSGRGLTQFDVDADGDLDLGDGGFADTFPRVLRNDIPGNAFTITLRGSVSNRLGVGARVRAILPTAEAELDGDGDTDLADRALARSVGSGQQPNAVARPMLEFPLAGQTAAAVEVDWPSGYFQQIGTLEAGALYVLDEPPMLRLLEGDDESDRWLDPGGHVQVWVCPYDARGERDYGASVSVEAQPFGVTLAASSTAFVPPGRACNQNRRSCDVAREGCTTRTFTHTDGEGSFLIQVTSRSRTWRVAPRMWVGALPEGVLRSDR